MLITHLLSILTIQLYLILPSTQVDGVPRTLQALDYNCKKPLTKKWKPGFKSFTYLSPLHISFSPRNTRVREFQLSSFQKVTGTCFLLSISTQLPQDTNNNLNETEESAITCDPNYIIFKIQERGFANGDCFWWYSQKWIVVDFEMLQLFITIQNLRTGASQWDFQWPAGEILNKQMA